MARIRNRLALSTALGVACVALLVAQLLLCFDNVRSESVINDDYRQNLFWAPSLAEPGLFTQDLLADYSRSFNPPGLKVLYSLALNAGFTGPGFGKLLSIVLFLVFLAGAARLGMAIGGRNATLVAPLLIAFILLNNKYYFRACMGGLARNFAFPLQVWMLWALFTRNRPAALCITLLSSLFHPQTFVICTISLGVWEALHIIRRLRKGRSLRSLMLRPALTLIAIAVAAVPVSSQASDLYAHFGPIITRSEIDSMDEFEPGGRWWRERPLGLALSLLEEFRVDDQLHRKSAVALDLRTVMAVSLGSSFVFWIFHLSRSERTVFLRWAPVLVILACGLLMFLLGDLLLARLYFPNRFLRPLIPLIITALVAERIASGAPAAWRRPARIAWTGWAVLVIVGMTRFFSAERDIGYPVDASEVMAAAAHVRNLPPDSLIAAFPREDADNLSTFGEHSLFIQREVSHPLYRGFLAEVRRRTYICLTGLFPIGGDRDVAILAREGVDYVLINKEMIKILARDGTTPRYDEPYGSWLDRRLSSADGVSMQKYWTVRMRPFVVYEDGRYLLVRIGHLHRPDIAAQTVSSPILRQ